LKNDATFTFFNLRDLGLFDLQFVKDDVRGKHTRGPTFSMQIISNFWKYFVLLCFVLLLLKNNQKPMNGSSILFCSSAEALKIKFFLFYL
jgi:hypothetical protein